MDYTMEDMRKILGRDYDKYSELVLVTHSGVMEKENKGFRRLKEVPDGTNKDSGTMVVMGKKNS